MYMKMLHFLSEFKHHACILSFCLAQFSVYLYSPINSYLFCLHYNVFEQFRAKLSHVHVQPYKYNANEKS